MTPLAWIVGRFLPGCGMPGTAGLPTPCLIEMADVTRPKSPNSALAAPAENRPAPDLITPTFPLTAPQLYALVASIGARQPRTFIAAEYPARQQIHFVVRSAVLNFPDLVTAQVAGAGPRASTLMLYSRSVYGYSDFGVNRRRLGTWLAALQSSMNRSNER